MNTCAYCGRQIERKPVDLKQTKDQEHVFPKCLYPARVLSSNIQLLTVPAHKSCNSSFSDDETHFRNVLSMCGNPNEPRKELWKTKVVRSFKEKDGKRRLSDLLAITKAMEAHGTERLAIYPARDPRVVRVVRKIVRGLSYHHSILTPISEDLIWVDVFNYVLPAQFHDLLQHHHREPSVAEYSYCVLQTLGLHSAWRLNFYQGVIFIALVFESAEAMAMIGRETEHEAALDAHKDACQ